MGFRKQLATGILLQVFLSLLICAVCLLTLRSLTRDVQAETVRVLDDFRDVHQLRNRAEQLMADARGYLVTGDKHYRVALDVARRDLAATVAQTERSQQRGLSSALAAFSTALQGYAAAVDATAVDREHETLETLERLYETRLAPQRAALEAALAALEETEREQLAAVPTHAERLTSVISLILVIACGTAVALSIMGGLLVRRRLTEQFQRVQAAEEQAKAAAAARQELLDIVSHDLRTPLNTIVLGLDVLRAAEGTSHPRLAPIENAAKQMARLVDDLLDAARAQTTGLQLTLTPTNSRDLLEAAREMLADRARRAGIELCIDTQDEGALVADRDRVLQILSNLIGNAIKVTPAGGKIIVGAHPTPAGMRFTVRDPGPGVTAEQVPELFQAYRQGDSTARARRGSLGLGLYISKTLAQAHGGTIGVESSPHEGSTFWFELPVAQ